MLTKSNLFNRGNAAESDSSAKQSPTSPASPSPKPVSPSPLHAYPSASLSPVVTPASVTANTEQKPRDTSRVDISSGNRLIVGPDVKLKGAEILDCGTLVVEGLVEATMDSRVIQIAADGAFSGKVGIDIAEVYGRFDGELTARDQLIVHSTGRVSGKIRYGKILVEEGGELSGDVAALGSEKTKAGSLRVANANDVAAS